MSTIQEFDFSVNILRALLWRNNEAPNIQALLEFKQANFDVENGDFWNDWIRDVFDLRTANEFGLNVWSIILGLKITIDPGEDTEIYWGFGVERVNFTNGNFTPAGSETVLTVEQARIVLRLRYYQLTTNGNVSSINLILADVFSALGPAYVVDGLDMTMQYVFQFPLADVLQLIMVELDVLPRPAGVLITIVLDVDVNWGFGADHVNFTNGNFTPLG